MNNDLKEFENLINEFEQSSEEFVSETRGGAGTPAERRLADAFKDQAATYRQMSVVMSGITEEQKAIRSTLERLEAFSDNMHAMANSAAGAYMRDYGKSLEELNVKANKTMEAIGGMDTRVAESYEQAVNKAIKKLNRATAASAGLLALLSIVGGLLAFIGAFMVFQAFPEAQKFIESVGWWTVLLILAAVAAVIWFGYCIWARNK